MTREELAAIAAERNECDCAKGDFDTRDLAYGRNGYHFILATADHCWRNMQLTRWTLDKNANDVNQYCNCTREVRRQHDDGSIEVVQPRNCACIYEGKEFAYELCPHFWRRANREPETGGLITYYVDPTNPRKRRWRQEGFATRDEDDLTSV